VFVGGNSQGGTVALHVGSRVASRAKGPHGALGGVLALRSVLLDITPTAQLPRGLPFFLFIAAEDTIYIDGLTGPAYERLDDAGCAVERFTEPGMEHEDENVVEHAAAAWFLAARLGAPQLPLKEVLRVTRGDLKGMW
jgi:predicted esterase